VTIVRPPLKAFTEEGDEIYVKILDSDAMPNVNLKVDAEPERVKVRSESYDQFTTRDDQKILIPVKSDSAAPTKIADGQTLSGWTENHVAVSVTGMEYGRPSAFKSRFDEMLRAEPQAGRIPRKNWYYFGLPVGRGVLAGGLTLMLVILPVVIIASQESLRAVPYSLREGALGMGATRWQVVWNVTLPAAVPGIMTGSILAMSRAVGEAAPILIICGIVFIGYVPGNLMDKFTVMPLQIYNWASQPDPAFQGVAATGIIVLLAALLTFNGIAVFIRQRMQKPLS
jgi:phosphate transport system permease protein